MRKYYNVPRNSFLKTLSLLFLFSTVCSLSSFGQGTDCSNANSITVNGSCITNATIGDGTANAPASNGCSYSFLDEGWYTFTTTSTMNVVITGQSTSANLYLQLIGGTCPGGITQLACANTDNLNNSNQTETLSYTNLASGTYYIRVVNADSSGPSMTLDSLCITGTIVCNSPTSINTVSAITANTATISWPAASPAPAGGYEWEVRTSGAGGSGATGLVASGTTAAGVTTANVTGLNPSTTYSVYVRSNCGSSTYSTWRGPRTFTTTIANDDPCGAIPITVGTTCSTTSGTNVGATATTVTPNNLAGCGSHDGTEADVWFTTTVPANGSIQIDAFLGTMTDPVIAVYTGSSCSGPLTLLGCNDDAGVGLEALLQLSGLTPGDTLYIRVWRYNGTSTGTFSICATSPSTTPPGNDLCANATNLSCGTNDMVGTTSGASNINPGVACTMSTYGVWYKFTGDGDLSVISVSPTSGYDVELSISSGSCGAFTSVACVDNNGAGTAETYSFVTTNGVTYYVYVADPFNGSTAFDTGDFTISRNCQTVTPPPNDDPCGAYNLVVNADCVTTAGTTQYATNTTGVAAPSCSGYSGGDVWFTVTVPPTASVTLESVSGVVTDSGMAVYAYTGDCSSTLSLFEITCENDAGMTEISLNASDGITPGQILYVRVWETGNNNNGFFSMCATGTVDPGTNGVTICAGDPSEPLTTDLFCNTGATTPYPLSGTLNTSDPQANRLATWIESNDPCNFTSGTLRYYDEIDFTVNATGTYVFTFGGGWDSMGYIYVDDGLFTPGSCASGTYIAGDDATGSGNAWPYYSQITANLVQGVNYTLVTTHWPSSASIGAYTWDVDVTPTSAEWYTASTGGSPVGYGAFFDPVTAGELPDTDTPGSYSFWVACDGSSTRTEAVFQIDNCSCPVSGTISGAENDCNNYDITVTIDEPGNGGAGWYVGYTIAGGPTQYVDSGPGYMATSPYTFQLSDINAPAGSLIELVYVANASNFCTTSTFIGSASTAYNCACITWDGSAGDDNWNTAANWSTNMVPTLSDCVVIPNTGGSDPIILDGIDAQALSLTINSGAGLTVESLGTITVQEQVNNSGYFVLQSNVVAGNQQDTGQLVQIDDTFSNTGSITMIRETNVRTQDYVYWSSPVQNFSITNIGSTTNRFEWIPTIATNLPGTFGNWQATSETMVAGKGYIVRAPFSAEPGNNPDTPTWNTQVFTGVPNNGIITRGINRGNNNSDYNQGPGQDDDIEAEDDNWNLVGNPYPSALDCDAFINHSSNSDINGTLYLWTHGTKIQQGYGSPFYGNYQYNYNIDDYLEYNLSGSNPPGFNGYIGSGQGFFVQMLHTASTPSSVTFDNSMRNQSNDNGQFFRLSNTDNIDSAIERHRLWLDLIEPSGNTNTTLIAYVEGATLGIDRLFDGATIGGQGKNIYSLIDEQEFSIQGRGLPFEPTDEVKIGISVNQAGEFALAINQLDGLFEETPQDIFVSDLETGIIHNLKEQPYFFTINEPGTFNNRLVITYTNATLSIDDKIKSEIRIMAPNNEYIKVISGTNQIQEIKVYDLLGRILINKQNINTTEYTINNVPKANGAYIVKVILANGIEKIQKIVLK